MESFNFDATLSSDDLSLLDARTLHPNALPLIQSIEEASRDGDFPAVKDTFMTLRHICPEQDLPKTGCALSLAIDHHHEEVVAYLLSQSVSITYHEVKKATLVQNKAILQLLFENGWDINTELGWSDPPALAYAVEDADLAAWFLAHGADPNAGCLLDKTPLSAAIQYAPLSVIEMLFDHGGNIEHGQLLHAAIWRTLDDRRTVVEYVLNKGAAVNAVMYQDKPEIYLMREPFGLGTPLHDAAAIGDLDLLRLLVSHGARLDIKDSLGYIALDRAERNGHYIAAQYLREQFSRSKAVL